MLRIMIKRVFCFVFLIMLSAPLSVQAGIQNQSDIPVKMDKIQELINYDLGSLFNKSELIGLNLTNYNISTSQYKQAAMSVNEVIRSSLSRIQMINNTVDITDEDKTLQINKVYQDIDAALYSLDSQTLSYIYALRNVMPTITYSRFVKKFEEFYNSLELTENKITLE